MAHKEQSELASTIKQAKAKVEIGEKYSHYKYPDQSYSILAIGFIEETETTSVVYQAEYGEKIVWIRPLEEFLQKFTIVK